MSTNRAGRGRGRGVLALTSFEPCPRPSKELIQQSNPSLVGQQHLKEDGKKPVNVVKPLPVVEKPDVLKDGIVKPISGSGEKLLAKYNYTAKPDQPGGFPELSIVQGERLTLIQKGHAATKNHLWWEVQNEKGETGYAPHNYCLVLEQSPSSLPWLENKRLMEEKEKMAAEKQRIVNGNPGFDKPTGPMQVKTYQSAYTTSKPTNTAEAASQYYCEICDKNLNGPQPYKMHMNSKAHREEVEYQNSK